MIAQGNDPSFEFPLTEVEGAQSYAVSDDLWVVGCYFNPARSRIKLVNFALFVDVLVRSGVGFLIVECAFRDAPFELKGIQQVVRVRSDDVISQKERLLNMAIREVPVRIKKIAWLDCDILFSNHNWLTETASALDRYPIVQPFHVAIRLARGATKYSGEGEVWEGFGRRISQNASQALPTADYLYHGHTGFAWAARRDLLEEHGLYDPMIADGADHFMAHAMCGQVRSRCCTNLISSVMWAHFEAWARGFHRDIQGRVGCIPGEVLHLWHGNKEDRRYLERRQELANFGFDPNVDLRLDGSGVWRWNTEKPMLHSWAVKNFFARKEDG